jgi:hypothetical protein
MGFCSCLDNVAADDDPVVSLLRYVERVLLFRPARLQLPRLLSLIITWIPVLCYVQERAHDVVWYGCLGWMP